jgi:hypothetical protein
MDPYLQEAESRRYSCCGVLRLRDGTYAFLAPGYRVVESGITAARLIELIDQYEHNRPLYQPSVESTASWPRAAASSAKALQST